MNKNDNYSVDFKDNLSAYIDNELEYNKNIKIKKLTIANPSIRKELENMYKFRKLLFASYQRTKSEMRKDYSKHILSKVSNEDYYSTTYFKKIAIVFVAIVTAIISGFIYLYF